MKRQLTFVWLASALALTLIPLAFAMPAATLGNYPNTIIPLGANTTITPDATPTATVSINVSTSTNFKGKLEGNPITGVVRVTDAHPAGTYTVTVTAFDSGGMPTTKTFTLTVTTPVTCNPVTFAPAANFPADLGAIFVAVGDFNRDGKQDLAVANNNANNVSILLGNGAGSFSVPANFPVFGEAFAVAVGDFNSDGNQDLAVTNRTSTIVSVLLGNGFGSFGAPTNFNVGNEPLSLAVGDFNGDGKQDLAVGNRFADSVSILLGDGTGSFTPAVGSPFGAGSTPHAVSVGDFNDDGNQDLAFANYNTGTVSVLLGNGAGSFTVAAGSPFSGGSNPRSLAIGDFNGDGRQDIAISNSTTDNLSVLLGNGMGGFGLPTNFPVGAFPISIAVGDFDGDGNQDLATANTNSNNVSVLLGNGAGSFSAATNFGVGNSPRSLTVGDFNGDGKQDFATANAGSNDVSVLLRDCSAACVITCPANVVKSNDLNQCGAVTTYPPPTISPSCDFVGCLPASGSFFPVGTTTVTCFLVGAGGEIMPGCSFTVTVNDTQAPTITCPADLTRGTAGNLCAAVVTFPSPTVSDNCPGSTVSCTPPSGSTFPKGMTAVNCAASDGTGNTANCSFTVTVNDTTPPTITCPPNQSVTSAVPTVVNYPAPTAADNCPGVTSLCAPPSGSLFAPGTTTVTCTANDTSANGALCTFTVTVAPCTITCPNNVVVQIGTNATTCGSNVSYSPPVVVGGCGPATCSPASGSFFSVGATTVTCNLSGGLNCSFTVIVLDNTSPRITCPDTIVTAPAPGQSSTVVNYPAATVTDNCPETTVQCSPPAGSRFPFGTTFVNCIALDASSNSAACVFRVIVVDSDAPVITCPANVAVATQSGQTSAVVNYPPPNVKDNSAVATFSCLPASGSSFPLGVTTVTCTATDAAGNKASCSFTVSVGGPQAKVALPGGKAAVEFGNPISVAPARKPPKAKKNPCGLFTVQNIGFAPLVLTLDSITRTGGDVDSRKIANANDTRYFDLSLLASDGSPTSIDFGSVVTIQPGGAQMFCLRFSALIPALAGKASGVAAADALPDTVTSIVTFRQNAGSPVSVSVLSHLATAVIFINPTNPRKAPSMSFTHSGDDLTISYALYDPNLDVSRAKYEFFDAGGAVVAGPFDIDLVQAIRERNLVRGQSFTVTQHFTGASTHPEVVAVRVTIFDGETSVVSPIATLGAAAASVMAQSRRQAHLRPVTPAAARLISPQH